MNITFSNPEYLLFLLIIPGLIFFHFVSIRGRNKRALKFANFDAISRIKGVDLFSRNIIVLILSCLIISLLVFSTAGTKISVTRKITDFSFVIAVDSSSSMSADDFEPNRMEFSKIISKELIDVLPTHTEIGVISFGAYCFIEQDLTKEKSSLKSKIDRIEIQGIGGTGFYEAAITSSNLLYNEKAKALVLLSDGQATIDDVESAIRHAIKNNMVIHTIAIATEEGGEAIFGISKLDRETLKALSYQTGGFFIEGKDKEEIKEEFNKILSLEEGKISIALSFYLIIISIVLFTIERVLINLKYDFVP